MHSRQDRFFAEALRKVEGPLEAEGSFGEFCEAVRPGAEKELLLSDIDEADFYKFLGGFDALLKKRVALGY